MNIIPSTPHEAARETPRRQALVVYPNPATEVLYIKDLPCEAVEYAIYDVYGQKMATGFSTGAIPVAELSKGVYLLQVRGDKFQKTAKFIVK